MRDMGVLRRGGEHTWRGCRKTWVGQGDGPGRGTSTVDLGVGMRTVQSR